MTNYTKSFLGLFAATVLSGVVALGEPVYLSPSEVALGPDGKTLFVTEATAHQIAVVDTETASVVRRLPLSGPPGGLAVLADGRLLVGDASPEGFLLMVRASDGEVLQRVRVGHTPVAVVPDAAGKRAYVCNQFTHDVSVVDLVQGRETARIKVSREPVAAALSPKEPLLLVANLLPTGPATAATVAAVISWVATDENKVVAEIPLLNGSHSVQDICFAPDGKHAYAVHTLSHFQLPTTQLERGWMNTSALSIIDTDARKLLNTVLLDDVDLGAPNPWSVACSPDGRWLCVSHAGSHELSLIDRAGLHAKLDRLARGEAVSNSAKRPDDVPCDLSFLVDLRTRVRLAGASGPRGLAVSGEHVYVAEYFADRVAIVPLEEGDNVRPSYVRLGPELPLTPERQGEIFFHDASLCFQQWQSCLSCHPGVRADALNWDLLNDGMGNPKNTKSLVLAHATPPAMALAIRESAEAGVRAGLRYIQFSVRPEEDAVALDAYLKSLSPVPSPYLEQGQLSERARQGRQLFQSERCDTCHTTPLYTDQQSHELGTGRGLDEGVSFDTPTLLECWRTAPYLHDGRAASIEDLLREDRHGLSRDLSADERSALAEFVLSL